MWTFIFLFDSHNENQFHFRGLVIFKCMFFIPIIAHACFNNVLNILDFRHLPCQILVCDCQNLFTLILRSLIFFYLLKVLNEKLLLFLVIALIHHHRHVIAFYVFVCFSILKNHSPSKHLRNKHFVHIQYAEYNLSLLIG